MNQYFNRDVNALSQANQAQSGMRALRGEESAMDLKKIVLPTPDGLEQTEGLAEIASKVVSACERSEGVRGALVGLAQWAQENEGKESFNRRWAELDEMVEARKIAMARLKKLDVEKTAKHPTIAQLLTRENATDTPEDVVGGAQEALQNRPSHSQKACLSVSKRHGASKQPRLDQVAYCALNGISNTAIFSSEITASISRLSRRSPSRMRY